MEQGKNHINGCNLHEGRFEEKANISYLVYGSGSSAYICQVHRPIYLKKKWVNLTYINYISINQSKKEKRYIFNC